MAAASSETKHLFITRVKIDGQTVEMFADNGATHSTITKNLRDQIAQRITPVQRKIRLLLANGRTTEANCEVYLIPVQIDREPIIGEFLFSSELKYPYPIMGHVLMGQLHLVCDNTTKTAVTVEQLIARYSPMSSATDINWDDALLPVSNENNTTELTLREDEAIGWSTEQRAKLAQHIHAAESAFDENGPPSSIAVHHIDTADARPVFRPPYPIPGRLRSNVKQLIDDMLVNGIIEQSTSPWGAPLLPRSKPDGSVRLCADYRKLNEATVADRYPLPNLNDLLHRIGKPKAITLLDLRSGYWQIPVDEADKSKTAFVCEFGLFQFNRMPFGLRNAPACFQRAMDQLKAQMPSITVLAYLDDLAILSESIDEHIDHANTVLETMNKYNLRLRRDKCRFGVTEFKYLGHIINENGISPDATKIEAIQHLARPKNPKKIKSFVQTCGWFRRFIKGFANITELSTRLTQSNTVWQWTNDQEQAFATIKKALTSAPILKIWDPSLPLTILTDASGYAIGAALLQDSIDKRHVVEFASRQLNSARRWPSSGQ